VPQTPTACQDLVDNDGDGAIDAADVGCQSPYDLDDSEWNPAPTPEPTPTPTPECSDGIDNDGDLFVDTGLVLGLLADPECTSAADTSESS
jgi:hypothetical protein